MASSSQIKAFRGKSKRIKPHQTECCEGVPAAFGLLCPGKVLLEEFGLCGVPPHNFLANSAPEGLY